MSNQSTSTFSNELILGLLLSSFCIILYIFDFQYSRLISTTYYLIAFTYPFILNYFTPNLDKTSKKENIFHLIKISTLGIALFSVFYIVYLLYINPEFGDVTWQIQKEEFIANGFDESLINEKESLFKKINTPYMMGLANFFSLIIFGIAGSIAAGLSKNSKLFNR